jgi:hypothetical protein
MTIRLGTAALVVVGTAAFLALAIVARGGFGAFFSHTPLTALAVITIILAVVSLLLTSMRISHGVDGAAAWLQLDCRHPISGVRMRTKQAADKQGHQP